MRLSDTRRSQIIVDTVDSIYRTIPTDYDQRQLKHLLDNKNQLAIILSRFEDDLSISLDVGHGWLPMIIRLDQKLNLLCPTYTISLIKQKFGSLRYYAHCIPFQTMTSMTRDTIYEAFSDLVRYTEYNSEFACEVCAGHGQMHSDNGWLSVCCHAHAKGQPTKNLPKFS